MSHIVAPLKKYERYDRLIDSVAAEFYVGMIPSYWRNVYGSIGLNRRDFSFCNLSDSDELYQLVSACHAQNKPVSITLNNHYYTVEQEPLIKQYIDDCANVGIDSFIVADPTVIKFIKEVCPHVRITISSEAGCYSGEDILNFADMGIQRIIFPRDMTIQEMAEAIQWAHLSDMEYEAFIFGPRCTYSGPYCTMTHGLINGPSFCSYKMLHSILRTDGKILSQEEKQNAARLLRSRNRWSCNKSNDEEQFDTCGICAIDKLEKIGVHYLKIVGREYSLEENLANIQKVQKAIEKKDSTQNEQKSTYCRNGLACYYSLQDINTPLSNCTNNLRVSIGRKDFCPETSSETSLKNMPEIAVLCNVLEEVDINRLVQRCDKQLEQWKLFESPPKIHRLYFGNEFCEKKIPSLYETQTALEACHINGWEFTLLLPPMSTRCLSQMAKVVETVTANCHIEIVCNSWGSIHFFRTMPNVTLVLGRLLNKIKHDPFLYEQMDEIVETYKERYHFPDADVDSIKNYYLQSNVNIPVFNQLLLESGVKRIETDLPYQKLNDSRFHYTLYHPIQYVTLGRYCLWGAMNITKDEQKFRPDQSCGQVCETYVSRLHSYDTNLNLFSKGCAIFAHKDFGNIDISTFDRIVVESTLPI